MAWYYGTFSCGCEGRVNITGPTKNRQWIADKKFDGLCEECYIKWLETEKERKNQEALVAAKEMELPELTGSEKQIVWAITLRQNLITKISEKIDGYENDEKIKKAESLRLVLDYMINNKTEAKYYIDNRNYTVGDLAEPLYKEYKNYLQKQVDAVENKEVIEEGTIAPVEVKFNGIVQIQATKERITVQYEKNDTFREILKSLNFKWNENKWQRDLSELTGTYIDRAAELGNKLLIAGFTVCIIDEQIRDKAITGTFEKECDRWIKLDKENNKLAIRWYDKNDYMYSAAKKIKTSFWKSEIKSILVDVSHFEEVREFADFYECKFTKDAESFIEKYKNALENIEVVEPVKIENKSKEDGLKKILNSSRDILDDLKEDD